jgi:HEAT repeat protein
MLFKPDILKFKQNKNVKGLIKALKYHGSHERSWAAEVLGDLGETSAVEPLIDTLKDKDINVRWSAVKSLGKIGDRRAALPIAIALTETNDWQMPLLVREALVNIGQRNCDALMDLMTHSNSDIRQLPAKILGEIGCQEAIEGLISALKNDENFMVRGLAAKSLGQLGDKFAVVPLINSISDQDGTVILEVIEALGILGDARAIDPLVAYLSDKNNGSRGLAATALGKIGDKRAVEALVTALTDESLQVRIAATEALLAIGDHQGNLAAKSRIRSMEHMVDQLCILLDEEKPFEQPRKETIQRARDFGMLLNNQGGFELMKRVMGIITQRRPFDYQRLNFWWDKIGTWRY